MKTQILKNILLEDNNWVLLEDNNWGTGVEIVFAEMTDQDNNWGTGVNMDGCGAEDPSKWPGTNMLGWALSTVRDNLRDGFDVDEYQRALDIQEKQIMSEEGESCATACTTTSMAPAARPASCHWRWRPLTAGGPDKGNHVNTVKTWGKLVPRLILISRPSCDRKQEIASIFFRQPKNKAHCPPLPGPLVEGENLDQQTYTYESHLVVA